MALTSILKSKADVTPLLYPFISRLFLCRNSSTSPFDDRSSTDPQPPKKDDNSPSPSESLTSYIGDVKSKLTQKPSSPSPQSYLSGFRRQTASPSGTAVHASLEEMYKKNLEKPSGSGHREALQAIRQSLWSVGKASEGGANRPISFGGQSTQSKRIPLGVEMGSISGKDASKDFVWKYSCEELGTKLAGLRPEKKIEDGGWFSLQELGERLKKLRENDDKDAASRLRGVEYQDLRNTLVSLTKTDSQKKLKKPHRILSNMQHLLGKTPEYMMYEPKEQLVEKYFHPDNMSASEKLKFQLAKVREEFKTSESDCGSARVQVAQLTTKIKYLSSVLHKKDKHSQKGLQAMVQKRKKLLKYLRRTDWDSYCFVLAKLGLRDNQQYKIRSH